MSGKAWTDSEIQHLRALYPTGDKAEILAVLEGRTWRDIQKKACRIKVRRLVKWINPDRRPLGPLAPLLETLKRRRIEMNMCATVLAERAGYSRNCVTRWEGPKGDTIGSRPLQDWANALGYELALVPIKQAAE